LEALLGPERLATFERSRDPRYHETFDLFENLELPPSSAGDLYQSRLEFDEQASAIRQLPGLEEDDRRDLLSALRLEAQQRISQQFGADLLDRVAGSYWLTQLSHVKP
jgi:hypothetical protein